MTDEAAITVVEKWLIGEIAAAVTSGKGSLVRKIESLGDRFNADTIKTMRNHAPAVYVFFAGGTPGSGEDGVLDSTWQIFPVTGQVGPEEDRRHGDGRSVGAYELVGLLIARLDGISGPGNGKFKIARARPLVDQATSREKLTIYELAFTFPMGFDGAIDPETLNAFETFHVDWDIPPHGNVTQPLPAADADASDTTALEQ